MDTQTLAQQSRGRKYHEVFVIRGSRRIGLWATVGLLRQYFVGWLHNWIIGLDRPL